MFSRTLRAGTLAVALAATTVVNPYATAIATPTDSVPAAVTTEASTDLDAAVRDAAEKQQAYDAALVRLSTVKTEQAQAIKDAEARLAALEDEFNAAEAADSAKADELRADRARLIALEQERQAQGDYAGARDARRQAWKRYDELVYLRYEIRVRDIRYHQDLKSLQTELDEAQQPVKTAESEAKAAREAWVAAGERVEQLRNQDAAPEHPADPELPALNNDHGPRPYVVDIDEATVANEFFRDTLWTGTHLQLTVMTIPPGGEIGAEIHNGHDQFIRLESGSLHAMLGKSPEELEVDEVIHEDWAAFIPSGTWHNFVNESDEPAKLYSIYAGPEHAPGTRHETKADADQAEADAQKIEESVTP